MPRIRYLKPEFFSDEDLAKLPHSTRLTFAGLWCWADREGRLEDRPGFLKAMIFPYIEDAQVDMENELILLSQPKISGYPFINRYSTENRRYIQIISWKDHQSPHNTEKQSKIPAPTEIPLCTPPKEQHKEKDKDKCAYPPPLVKQPLDNRSLTVKKDMLTELNGNFDKFWKEYPKKVGKQAAITEWKAAIKKGIMPEIDAILHTLQKQKESDQWTKDSGQFIPNPATWLHQGRWDDEVKTWKENVEENSRWIPPEEL
jgi:hypothetical protein